MQLPLLTGQKDLSQAFTKWKSILDPLLAQPLSSMLILEGVKLINGATVINHTLGRMQQGWFLTDINGAATIYRSSPLSATTLTLTSSAAVTVNLGVF